ncbi:hypothetical protein EVAR_56873_1 [Eumeta japonica]|uniref:Uncharacterized protein n=1 Tax=Eumeta variegata TaxID=151549 RepID=A0A4C1ZBQ4_EUMVA|nr:hypothetical protein EVAR_56873_1 [Eumeta japonica]
MAFAYFLLCILFTCVRCNIDTAGEGKRSPLSVVKNKEGDGDWGERDTEQACERERHIKRRKGRRIEIRNRINIRGINQAEDSLLERTSERNFDNLTSSPHVTKEIEEAELLLALAEKKLGERIPSMEENVAIYDNIVNKLSQLERLCMETENTHAFLDARGLQRIIQPNLDSPVPILRSNLLKLLKTLFTSAPVTTKTMVAPKILDRMLVIFEDDPYGANKATIVDIFRLWLPDNPEIQRRLVNSKGLERMHQQVPKLNGSVINNMLGVFNLILEEHVDVHNMVADSSGDRKKKKTYQRVGFLDKMTAPEVCRGLLQTMQFYWNVRQSDDNVLHVLGLLRNVEPFCLTAEKGAGTAALFIDNLLTYFAGDKKFASALDVRKIRMILQEYANRLNVKPKDEF